jgi:dienelactone hydrolase
MIGKIIRLFLWAVAAVLALALASAAALALLVFARYHLNDRPISLPTPRGPHLVGRSLVEWHDKIRNRDLVVFIWYPADPGATGDRCEYLPGKWGELNAKDMLPIPAKRVREIGVSAIGDAPLAQEPMPVLVMLPGMGRNPANYTTLAEDLASFGNLVLGVAPTGSTTVVFPDGTVEQAREFDPRLDDVRIAQGYVDEWSEDASFALSQLLADSRFSGHILPADIGVFGHSFGGNVALHLLETDLRFARAADIDGAFFGKPFGHLSKPILILGAVGDLGSKQRALYEHGVAGSHFHLFPGAKHMNFSDAGVLPSRYPIPKRILMLGDIDGALLLRETSDQLRAFFDDPSVHAPPAHSLD